MLLPGLVLWRSLVGLDELHEAQARDLGYLAERYLYLLLPRIFQTIPRVLQEPAPGPVQLATRAPVYPSPMALGLLLALRARGGRGVGEPPPPRNT